MHLPSQEVLKGQVQVLACLFRDEVGTVVPLQDIVQIALAQPSWLIAVIDHLLQVLKRFGRHVFSKHDIVQVAAQS